MHRWTEYAWTTPVFYGQKEGAIDERCHCQHESLLRIFTVAHTDENDKMGIFVENKSLCGDAPLVRSK